MDKAQDIEVDIRMSFGKQDREIVRINRFETSIRDPEYNDRVYIAEAFDQPIAMTCFARGVGFDGES